MFVNFALEDSNEFLGGKVCCYRLLHTKNDENEARIRIWQLVIGI